MGMHKIVLSVWIYTFALMHYSCQTTTLTPAVADVIEGNDVTLVCKMSDTLTYTSWLVNTTTLIAFMAYAKEECAVTGFLLEDKYSYKCNSTVFQLTITDVNRSQHNNMWSCKAGNDANGPDSVIKVKVPIASVTITPPTSIVAIEEYRLQPFKCNTSEGRPAGTVLWYKIKNGVTSQINQNISEIQNTKPTGFIETTSVLSFAPTKEQNGIKIYCEARNTANNNAVKSSEKQLNVLYKAVGPTITEGSEYQVLENVPGQLHCRIVDGNPTPSLSWNCNSWASSRSQVGETVTQTLSWTTARGQDSTCTCKSQQSPFPKKYVSINVVVLYPPSTPTFEVNGNTISGPIRFIEGKTRSIQCVTESNPPPQKYTWTKAQSSPIDGQIRTFNNVQRSNAGQYSCAVQNTMNPSSGGAIIGTNISSVSLQVLYQPSMIKFYYGENVPIVTNNMIDVILEDTVSITCNATDGNPAAHKYKWRENQNNGRVWTPSSIQHDENGMCTATNTMQETGTGVTENKFASEIMKINVLAITECNLRYLTQDIQTDAPETLKIIIGHSISLSCAATGTPRPMMSWEGPLQSKYSSELILRNVNKTNDGQYTFIANSTLMRTFGSTERKNKSREFQLDILYPPKIGNLPDMDIEEGAHLNKRCPFTPGNPPQTTAKWTRNIDDKPWNKEALTIQSVNRSDDATYTCEIYNVMEPTAAPPVSTDVKETGTFHLNVQYKAVVTSLYVLGSETNTEVTTVNETNHLQLNCTVISNPLPTIQIRKGDKTLNSSTGNMIMLYSIGNAMCLHAGNYTCFGSNKVNKGEEASKQLQVNVNCSPRPADTVNLNRRSEKNETFTFTFNAIAYPVPVFIWKKWVGDVWKRMQDSDNVTITSSDVQSNLTIHNLGQGDFGKYLLVVSNDFGQMEFQYQLEQDDEPGAPTDFRHVEHLTTESSIQLEWKPGFNGGPPQTFYIRYKKSSSNSWNYVSVLDTREQTMRYMLTGLDSDTQYQVMVYSSNRKGNSSESEHVIAKTKGRAESNPAPLIGGVIGGIVICLVIIVVTVLTVRHYQTRKGKNTNSAAEKPTGNQYETNKSADDVSYYNIGREEQVASQTNSETAYSNEGSVPDYEELNKQNMDVTTYSSLQPNSRPSNGNTDERTYENLQLRVM